MNNTYLNKNVKAIAAFLVLVVFCTEFDCDNCPNAKSLFEWMEKLIPIIKNKPNNQHNLFIFVGNSEIIYAFFL